jgi:hypothetical protein
MPLVTNVQNSDGNWITRIQVRSFIAVSMTLAVIAGFFMKLIDAGVFINMAMMAITWYFSKRQTQEDSGSNNGTTSTSTPNIPDTSSVKPAS